MAWREIRLRGSQWEFDDEAPIAPEGGFGEVFHGRGPDGEVAIKRLKLRATKAAHRELKIGKELMQRSLSYIVPIIDAGQDAESDRYFLVMPLCEASLQDLVNCAGGAVSQNVAHDAINAIVNGLMEVEDITHRDLKPANILLHEGRWKIADFGIAKFVQDSTSLETLRGGLTPLYAAPEQWRGERPSAATDVYALGCIIYTLFTGHPPFDGSQDDLREKHLHEAPPTVDVLPPRMATFVSQMLRKPPDARPTLARCTQVLPDIGSSQNEECMTQAQLAEAAQEVAECNAKEDAKRCAEEAAYRLRRELYDDASATLTALRDKLFAHINEASDAAIILPDEGLGFGYAILRLTHGPEMLHDHLAKMWAQGSTPYHLTGWDVVGWAILAVQCTNFPSGDSYTWSASLLFANRHDGSGYRWYEVAFYWSMVGSRDDEPFGLEGYSPDIDNAVGSIMNPIDVAYGPLPIDGEDEEAFIARWTRLVARAATGQLGRPPQMPIPDFQ